MTVQIIRSGTVLRHEILSVNDSRFQIRMIRSDPAVDYGYAHPAAVPTMLECKVGPHGRFRKLETPRNLAVR